VHALSELYGDPAAGVAKDLEITYRNSSLDAESLPGVTVLAQTTCEIVMWEMKERVAGQFGAWHDPHNNGTYTLLGGDASTLKFSRVTGNKKYTDKMTFSFDEDGSTCVVRGCSQSQVTSIADFSTNYCNLRMLYCGSKEGCKPVKEDFDIRETEVRPSAGAGKDPSVCLVR